MENKKKYQQPAMDVVMLSYNKTLLLGGSDPKPGGGSAPALDDVIVFDMMKE